MRHRLATLAMAATAVLGTGAAVATGPAQASIASHLPYTGSVHARPDIDSGSILYLVGPRTRCVVSQGPGNQAAIKDPAGNYCARWTWVNGDELQDSSGHCLRANSAGQAKLESTGCNGGDLNEQWYLHPCNSRGRCNFYNIGRGAYLKTNGDASGDLVYVGFGSGYFAWYF